jgi:hypothetical protein
MAITNTEAKYLIRLALEKADFVRLVYGRSFRDKSRPGYQLFEDGDCIKVLYSTGLKPKPRAAIEMLRQYLPHVKKAVGDSFVVELVEKPGTLITFSTDGPCIIVSRK